LMGCRRNFLGITSLRNQLKKTRDPDQFVSLGQPSPGEGPSVQADQADRLPALILSMIPRELPGREYISGLQPTP
jgi:hypothetical protein